MSNKPKGKVFSSEEPNAEFENAFSCNSSGCRSTCACGRECFDGANDNWDWDDGEFERLVELSEKEPENYVALPYSCSRAIVNGRMFVLGCPCNGLRPYQEFIDAHAEQIAKYLNKRSEQMREKSERIAIKRI